MTATRVQHEERTGADERVGYRRAYVFVSFGLLFGVAYRSFVLGEAAWDLLALVVLGGVVVAVDRGRERAPMGRWTLMSLLTALVAAVFAAALVTVGR
jgi:hypothetical protein